jgi:hypothetical protein
VYNLLLLAVDPHFVALFTRSGFSLLVADFGRRQDSIYGINESGKHKEKLGVL